jgi:hypothetical protein
VAAIYSYLEKKIMSPVNPEICPVCGVEIAGDRVNFSFGPPGTRSRLWQRVCQFAQKPNCINQEEEKMGFVQSNDGYGDLS